MPKVSTIPACWQQVASTCMIGHTFSLKMPLVAMGWSCKIVDALTFAQTVRSMSKRMQPSTPVVAWAPVFSPLRPARRRRYVCQASTCTPGPARCSAPGPVLWWSTKWLSTTSHPSTICRSWLPRTGSRCQQASVRETLDVRILTNLSEKVVLAGRTKLCLSLDSGFPIKLRNVWKSATCWTNQQQDGFEIDSLTVSCRNCPWGVTFNATKDRSLKAVSSEYLKCSKTVTAPLGAQVLALLYHQLTCMIYVCWYLHYLLSKLSSLPNFYSRR